MAEKSTVFKRSVSISGRRTSIALEDVFWDGLREIVSVRQTTLSQVLKQIDGERQGNGSLSSHIRMYVLAHYRDGNSGKPPSGT